MDLAASNRGDFYIVTVRGDVDLTTAPLLDDYLQRGISSGNTNLAIDLEECDYLDSEGIKVLIRNVHRLGDRGQLSVCGAQGAVRRVLMLSGLGDFLPVLHSINDLLGNSAPTCS